MPVPLTQNYITKDCLVSAGVSKWYIIPFASVTATTVVANVVTVITKATGIAFKTYAQEMEQSTWTYDGASTMANGTKAYDWNATLKAVGLNTLDQQEFDLLIQNKLLLVAEMVNGDNWMLGRGFGSMGIESKLDVGTAMGDYQGTVITIKGRSNVPALKVDSTIIATLSTPGV